MSLKHYYISAYASSPSPEIWDADKEARYFSALAQNAQIIGIEHPFYPEKDKYPLAWLCENIPSHWSLCITTVPISMSMSQQHPTMGIASVNKEGRQMAISLLQDLNQYVQTLNEAFARPVVKAIHLQTFPRQPAGQGSVDAVIESLHYIKCMDWHNAELNIEHCDAYIPGQLPEKGLLTLTNEIRAISEVGGFGLILNWARSAIESRNTHGPLDHIDQAIASKVLKGFFFSGCNHKQACPYGQWVDSHMPPQNHIHGTCLPADGLLDYATIGSVWQHLASCTPYPYLGIKITNRGADHSIQRSVGLIFESIAALDTANC